MSTNDLKGLLSPQQVPDLIRCHSNHQSHPAPNPSNHKAEVLRFMLSSSLRNSIGGLHDFCLESNLSCPRYMIRETESNGQHLTHATCRVLTVESEQSNKDPSIAIRRASYEVLSALFGLKRSIGWKSLVQKTASAHSL